MFNNYNTYAMENCPCKKDCKNRCANCHSICQKYIDWRKEYEEVQQQIKEKEKIEKDIYFGKIISKRWVKCAGRNRGLKRANKGA